MRGSGGSSGSSGGNNAPVEYSDAGYDRNRLTVVREKLWEAMVARRIVWISYNGGSVPLVPRSLKPLAFGAGNDASPSSGPQTKHKLFKALCLNENTVKTFNVMKVLEVRDEAWSLEDGNDGEVTTSRASTTSSSSGHARRPSSNLDQSTLDDDEDGQDIGDDDYDFDDDDDEDDDDDTNQSGRYSRFSRRANNDEFVPRSQRRSSGARASSNSTAATSSPKDAIDRWQVLVAAASVDGAAACSIISNYFRARDEATPSTSSSRRTSRRSKNEIEAQSVLVSSLVRISDTFNSIEREIIEAIVSAHGASVVAATAGGSTLAPRPQLSNYLVMPARFVATFLHQSSDSAPTVQDADQRRTLELAATEFTDASRTGLRVVDESWVFDLIDRYGAYASKPSALSSSSSSDSPSLSSSCSPLSSSTTSNSSTPSMPGSPSVEYYPGEDAYVDYTYGIASHGQGTTNMTRGDRLWRISLEGAKTTVSYGRIGGKLTTQSKQHANENEAYTYTSRSIKQKAASGYQIDIAALSRSATPGTPSTPSTPSTPATPSAGTAYASFGSPQVRDPITIEPAPSSSSPPLAPQTSSTTVVPPTASSTIVERYRGHRELCEWLAQVDLLAYSEAFIEHELTLDHVAALTEIDIQKQLHITKIGPLKRLTAAIDALAKKHSSITAASSQSTTHTGAESNDSKSPSAQYAGRGEVQMWLEVNQLERFAQHFYDQEMDLEAISSLEKADLIELGIDKMGPQRKFLTAIQALNRNGIANTISQCRQQQQQQQQSPSNSSNASDTRSSAASSSSGAVTSATPVSTTIVVRDVRIGEQVGAGQFGEVYRGVWQDSIPVALKRIKDANGQDKALREFEAEATVLIRLRHPHIVTFFGVYVDKDTNDRYLTLEWASEGSLERYLRASSIMSVKVSELVGFALDAARGMVYLSEYEPPVVHRDLALRNLLLTKQQDGRWLVKVGDFGLSRITHNDGDGDEQVYVTAHQLLLPIKWVSPEAIMTRHFSTRSDVWSFGVVLWEIFSLGQSPYPHMSAREVLQRVQTGYRMSQPNLCPEPIYRLMLECWHENPLRRPSFRGVYDALLRHYESIQQQQQQAASVASTQPSSSSIAAESAPPSMPSASVTTVAAAPQYPEYLADSESPDASTSAVPVTSSDSESLPLLSVSSDSATLPATSSGYYEQHSAQSMAAAEATDDKPPANKSLDAVAPINGPSTPVRSAGDCIVPGDDNDKYLFHLQSPTKQEQPQQREEADVAKVKLDGLHDSEHKSEAAESVSPIVAAEEPPPPPQQQQYYE